MLIGMSVEAQIVNIPDANFKNALVNTLCTGSMTNNNYDADVDTNDDGEIQVSEALAVNKLNLTSQGIADLTGIEAFSNLQRLICNDNQIAALTLNNFFSLVSLYCSDNTMTSLTITNCFNLNQLTCSNNLMTELDLSSTSVSRCYITNNPNLGTINVKNGIAMDSSQNFRSSNPTDAIPPPIPLPPSNISGNPNLIYVCGDDNELDYLTSTNVWGNNINLVISSYCTSVPGGTYNTVTGSVRVSCETFNIPASQVKINYTNGFQSGYTFTGTNGNYFFFVPAGNYTVTPEFGSPDYFTFAPTSSSVVFTETGNTQILDFCATPTQAATNFEITLLPIGAARPGFDAYYRILVKNKGYQEMSGTVTLTFDDTVSDFVSAVPSVTSQSTNTLTWEFSNLIPFETKTIDFTLNINAPTETPPVNIGDQLSYTATVLSSVPDVTPNDNTAILRQIVVGSYDPNDKIVFEGNQISTAEVGDYLHYMIRFQNTGTYPAEKVVVKDTLDDNLNWNTLEMVSCSHPYRSTLTNGNQLEVFYEGINLPPSVTDEPGSHGYIVFKIKPKATIAVNDVIDNTANIYFDFNFPIVTNTVSTTVTALGNNDFENNSFVLYPNPVGSMLNIQMVNDQMPKEIRIYNTLGQKLLSANLVTNIDVSTLSKGAYFITVETDSGKASQQFIKL